MTEQTPTPQELLPSPETFSTAEEMVALHIRMALPKEVNPLDPSNLDLPPVTPEQLTVENLTQTVKITAKGSVLDRINWWNNRLANATEEEKKKTPYEIWISDMTKAFSDRNNQEIIKRLSPRKIGGIDLSNFNQQEAKKTCAQIYQRYFADQKQGETVELVVLTENRQEKINIPSNLNQFIDDVIAAYNGNYDEIVADLPALKWYAGIFGTATKEEIEGKTPKEVHTDDVLKELIHARIKVENEGKKQGLITQANETKTIDNQPASRRNFLNEKEKHILTWLNQASEIETRIIQRKPPAPPIQTELPPQSPKPSEESLPQQETPWDKIPKPDHPVKIREAQIDDQGRLISPETYLVLGTPDSPLVTEVVLQDGTRKKIRERHPERPFHLPVIVYFDEDITKEQKNLIKETLKKIAEEIKLPNDFIIEAGTKPSNFFSNTYLSNQNQYLTEVILDQMEADPIQKEQPHYSFVFTNKDLTGRRETGGFFNFLVGLTLPDLGTVISLKRIWEGMEKNDPNLREETIRTEIAHEIGHVYGLPSERRGKKNLDYETVRGEGGHCKSPGCCMKQCNAVPADFIRITQERLRFLEKDSFYCDECHRDLENKFNPKTGKAVQKKAETIAEPKSFKDILQTIKEKAEASQPCEMKFDQRGLKMILENLVPSIELKKGPITAKFEFAQPAEVNISQKQGIIKLPLKINAGMLGEHDVTLTLTLDSQFNYTSVSSQPEQIFGQNVTQMIQQKPLSSYFKNFLQDQLNQQKACIDIETVDLQFTEDDKLAVVIKGRKRK